MKKVILGTLISTILSSQLFASCEVLNFGAYTPTQKFKLFGKDEKTLQVVDFQSVYSTTGKFYRDSDGKLQLKKFNDAYGEFFNYLKETAFEECKTNKYQGIVNVDIKFFVDENSYFFTATYNHLN
ncbi:hypothetical protein [Aliarcobacter butzleri]|uniref:hypothetical protein n=1 Tax=Aliarcobacter butzleri TaxID=28197 RepID=UPI003AFA445E